MALQICQQCGQRFAEVEHHFLDDRWSQRVCRSCRVYMLMIDHLGPDGYTLCFDVVSACDAGSHIKVDETMEKAISAVQRASGEENSVFSADRLRIRPCPLGSRSVGLR